MQGTMICLPVTKPARALKEIGKSPLAKRIAEKIAEIRGVSQIVCVAKRAADASAVAKLFPSAKAMTMEPSLPTHKLAAMCGAAPGTLFLAVSPTLAFLSAGKMEQCLREAKRLGAASPSRTVRSRGAAGTAVTAHETLTACEAIKVGHAAKFAPVPVTLLESLDAADDDEYALMTAAIAVHKL